MTTRTRRQPRPKPTGAVPATVRVHLALLEAVRARYPVARDWTDSQVAAACLAMAVKARTRPHMITEGATT